MAAIHLIWAGLAVALLYLPMSDDPPSWRRSGMKTLPLLAFAAAAYLTGAPAFLTAALLFSALGDFALSRRGEAAFLYGLAAFALAHLLFALVFIRASGHPLWDAFTIAPLLGVFLLGVGLSSEIWLVPHVGRLRWPVRAYVVVIVAMGLAALTLSSAALALAAGLFIASDILLALRLFRMSDADPLQGAAGWLVWLFYIAAQALFVTVIAG